MAVWSVVLSKSAEADFAKLDFTVRRRIAGKLDWLKENFSVTTPEPLIGKLSDFFKLRIGDWRVIYRVKWDDRVIAVHGIVHRSKAYKG